MCIRSSLTYPICSQYELTGEEKNIDKKLKVDGYFDDDLLHPYLDDDWHYDKWAWEYDGGWYEDEIEYHEENAEWSYRQSDMGALKRAGPVDDVMPPSLSLAPTVTPGPTGLEYTPDDMTHLGMAAIQARSIDGSSSGGSLLQKANGLNVIPQSGLPQTITKPQHLAFSFPTIQHMIYSGSINLKAHSAYDLSQMDPEIFGVLQSMLTPYLQAIVGHTLQAYNLEVDYTPGHAEDQSAVAAGGVVTNLEVACTLKVRSDSVASLKRITHKQAKQWIRDFFSGHEMGQFLNELSSNNINVNEIVFVEDQFATPANGGQVIAGIESGGNGNGPSSSSSSSSSDGNPGVVIGVAIAMVAVGAILFLHFTGHLPYREKLSELRILMRHSLSCDSGSEGYHGGSSDGNGTKDEENDQAPSGRRRTWSATFRRHPDAGIRKAALQKKPARSEDYLSGGSTSTVSKQSNSSGGITNNTPLSSHKSDRTHGDTTLNPFEPGVDFDDYSYSVGEDFNVGGDYDMAMRSRGSPSRRSSRPSFSQGASPRTNTAHTRDDEFSMPEDYDTVLEGDSASLYSKWSQSVMTKIAFMPGKKRRTKMPTMSPPPGSPRRVTPSDLESTSHRFIPRSVEANAASVGQNALNGRDEWSVDSYDTKSPSAHCVYRDWSPNGNGVRDPTAGSSSRRTKLAIPRFN